jgi:hypothetical protein
MMDHGVTFEMGSGLNIRLNQDLDTWLFGRFAGAALDDRSNEYHLNIKEMLSMLDLYRYGCPWF